MGSLTIWISHFFGINQKTEEAIDFSLNNHGFPLEGSYETETLTILDNDYKISKKCLTFMKHN